MAGLLSRHASLAWPAGDPARLEAAVRRLASLAEQVDSMTRAWTSPHMHATWTGVASTANADEVLGILTSGTQVVEPIRRACEVVRRLATALRLAQAEIGRIARRLEAAEQAAFTTDRRANSADADARVRETRAMVDPSHRPAAVSARSTATDLASLARRAELDRQAVLLDSMRRATTIANEITALDRLTAAAIDPLLTTAPDGATGALLHPGITDPRYRSVATTTPPVPRHADRQLLRWSPVGDGTIVEVFGDLARARHIAVVVPGVMTTADNFDVMVANRAESLYRASIVEDPAVAVVAWLGYDTPEILNATSKRRARENEHRLRDFVEALPNAHVTVVAHSYGSVLAGEAALTGLHVEDLVMLGSPGTSLDTAGDAVLAPGGQIWAAVTDTDVVGRVGLGSLLCPEVITSASGPWRMPRPLDPGFPGAQLSESCQIDEDGDVLRLSHGINPAHDAFGAIEIPTTDIKGHSSYLDTDTTTIAAIAKIVTNRHESQR